MAEPTLIAVPAELLAGMADTMRDAATLARDTSGGLRALEAKIDALAKAQAEHAQREEPALAAYEGQVKRMLSEDADATAEARTAAKRAETERARQRAELQSLIVRIVLALGGLALGAGGMAALGGSP